VKSAVALYLLPLKLTFSAHNSSAVQKGYWNDEFVKYFVKGNPVKRPPLINRGYFSRMFTIQYILDQFFQLEASKKQIVSFGAGFDTTFFRLKVDSQFSFPFF
jgi:O-methyltransferase involved in polyketide biosynthesis